ncbi:MAG: hypothetical protein V7767_03105 [Leeuwenhoekiella sp.]
MRIHWTPDVSADSIRVQELLKIEYDFRKALTKVLLSHALFSEGESDLEYYEFCFNTTTKKFSLAPTDQNVHDLGFLMDNEHMKRYF